MGWKKRAWQFNTIVKILDDNYRIIIVGLSEEQVSQIPSNIYVVKATNDVEELAELYAIADYFVNPTYEDNYPTTNLEAISCGTPVLTYNTGGSPEKLHCCNGKGFWHKGNIKAIAGQIRSSEIIKKGKYEYWQKYSSGQVFKRYSECKKWSIVFSECTFSISVDFLMS